MKAILLFLIIVFVSCKTADKPIEIDYAGFVKREISLVGFDKQVNLTDSLASLSIMIPLRLDTFYQWHRTSDCLGCGRLQYRFADKRYSQFAESGFYWIGKPDSAYHMTIKHTPIRETPDSMILKHLTSNDKDDAFYHQVVSVSFEDSVKYISKEFKVINNRSFVFSALPLLVATLLNQNLYL